MKPSDRIKEIYNPLDSRWYSPTQHISAIEQYLDEEWEKNKPCEHEPYGEGLSSSRYVCKKCHVIYYE